MPYYHSNCHGQIKWFPFLPISPVCKKCGEKWNPLVVYGPKRKDMYYIPQALPTIPKGTTSYAKWADQAMPGVALVASRLPNWPRWLRLTSFLVTVVGLSGLYYGLSFVGLWAILLVTVLLALSPLVIFFVKRRRG